MVKRSEKKEQILSMAHTERLTHPRMGCRKLYGLVQERMAKMGLSMVGRDAFFELMGMNNMHVERKKKFSKTTYSKHSYAISPNRIKDLELKNPNQVFVSDITYIRTVNGFAYLFLVTDLFSRKIVGWSVRSDLNHQGAVDALNMAIKGLDESNAIIHHSDRGSQYCCHDFLKAFKNQGVAFSNTDDAHVYQNAVAERVNGILKDEYHLDATFMNIKNVIKTVKQVVYTYNNLRPHMSIEYQTPQSVYDMVA